MHQLLSDEHKTMRIDCMWGEHRCSHFFDRDIVGVMTDHVAKSVPLRTPAQIAKNRSACGRFLMCPLRSFRYELSSCRILLLTTNAICVRLRVQVVQLSFVRTVRAPKRKFECPVLRNAKRLRAAICSGSDVGSVVLVAKVRRRQLIAVS